MALDTSPTATAATPTPPQPADTQPDAHPDPDLDQDPTLHLPRILCLHGRGTNARIFHTQCRALRAHLAAHFRLVFADAPFPSGPGPGVESVFGEWGPFWSWWRLLEPQQRVQYPAGGAGGVLGGGLGGGMGMAATAPIDFAAVDEVLDATMREDDRVGATGEWVGLLGFSQGARMAGCLFLRQQERQRQQHRPKEEDEERVTEVTARESFQHHEFKFAVLLAGRGPLEVPDGAERAAGPAPLLRLPTVHVHGTLDAGLAMHRQLLRSGCAEGSARLVEWAGGHRVPIKSADVAPLVTAMLEVAAESGAIKKKE